ncbi:guanylate kinase [Elizabethkingia sp. JS20170427COW]|uniref:guanylate kinase n=1 Tax=Elizabethkingia sp. JS20170427COW TaxID=2583851 RepID=UPI001110E154|nr:guanylate kinase [Elizabethkingia sp. JS20170427COW]QCX52820.1 guanylate kinase [Elizabethkingia sp. JS20170427COW]
MSSKKVIIFSAPSGSGKTTLVKYCLDQFAKLQFSISATTRQPRGEEKHGVDYFFHTPDEFRQKIALDAFVEYEEVYTDKYYGTLKSEVERIWDLGNVVIFDVDVKGGVNLKKIFAEKALSIFIAPPSIQELENRLIKRNTDDLETIKTRVAKAEEELGYAQYFDEVIVNDDLNQAKEEIAKLVGNFIEA